MNRLSPCRIAARLLAPTVLGICAFSSVAHAQTEPTAQVNQAPAKSASACPTVQIQGLKPGQGFLMLAAYDSATEYFKKSVWQVRLPVTDTQMLVTVCDLANKEIAFSGYQDLNGNGKLDSNPLGIPNEPYGSSGTPPAFSAPTWQTTKVKVAADSVVIVKM